MSEWHFLPVPSKVNLRLKVLAREVSGYHQVETLMAAVEWGDRLWLRWLGEGRGVELRTTGEPVGPVEENLAYRAADRFLARSGVGGRVELWLEKKVPPGTGLGGGSADAAFVLRGLNAVSGAPLDPWTLTREASALGSDVPFFTGPAPLALAWGRGGRMLGVEGLPPAPVVLALPGTGVETPWAYRALSGEGEHEPGTGSEPFLLDGDSLTDWTRISRLAENDFEGVVLARHPALARIRASLADSSGARFALLSGSGSASYGVFRREEDARAAAKSLAPAFPDVRFVATRTVRRFPSPVVVGGPGDVPPT